MLGCGEACCCADILASHPFNGSVGLHGSWPEGNCVCSRALRCLLNMWLPWFRVVYYNDLYYILFCITVVIQIVI